MLVLGIASFIIATIGVLIGVLSFIKINDNALRYALGSAFLLLTLLFSIVGLYAFFNVIVSDASSGSEDQEVSIIQPESQLSENESTYTPIPPTSTSANSLSQTNTPQPVSTTPTFTPELPPTWTPTSVILPTDTPTLTPLPTAIPIPTATPLPIAVSGLLLLIDERFDNADKAQSQWEKHTSAGGVEYKDGKAIIRCTTSNGCWAKSDRYNDLDQIGYLRPNFTFDDFIVQFDSQYVDGTLGGVYGIRFGYRDAESYYDFLIRNDRRYEVYKGQGLVLEGFSEIINPPGKTNRIQVEVNDGKMRFFINDQFIAAFEDTNYQEGDILLVMWRKPNEGTLRVAFDNVVIVQHP